MIKRLGVAFAALVAVCAPAAADWTFLDSSGRIQTFDAILEGSGKHIQKSVPSDPTGAPFSETNPLAIKQAHITWTQNPVVTLSAGVSGQLVAANPNRRALRWMVTGANPVTVSPGAVTVTAGVGMNYNGPAGAGFQGGSDSFAGDLSQQAFSAISTLGTTVIVWEGQ